jgi:hypothetical protein
LKNVPKTKNPKNNENWESAKINGFPNKDKKIPEKTNLAYKQWMNYKGKT